MRLIFTCVCCLLSIFFVDTAYASTNDYHPVTGEPNCLICHTPDRKYSIDYMREESCGECHGPFLSERYTAIDIRYKEADRGHKQEARGEIQEVRNEKQGCFPRNVSTGARIKEAKKIPKNLFLFPPADFTRGSMTGGQRADLNI